MLQATCTAIITRFRSPVLKKLRRGDALIITGDFGCIWDGSKKEKKMLKKLGKKKYNVLFARRAYTKISTCSKNIP